MGKLFGSMIEVGSSTVLDRSTWTREDFKARVLFLFDSSRRDEAVKETKVFRSSLMLNDLVLD
jgi:hypothetical protein